MEVDDSYCVQQFDEGFVYLTEAFVHFGVAHWHLPYKQLQNFFHPLNFKYFLKAIFSCVFLIDNDY